jgi:hypothetical protein
MWAVNIIAYLADLDVYYTDDDIFCVHEYMSKLKQGDVAVDLGTGWGKGALALALSNPDVTLHTYDTGTYPADRGFWTVEEYEEKMKERFETYQADNIILHQEDARFSETFPVDLLHVDIDAIPYEEKYELYKHWFPKVKRCILVRNYYNEDRDDKKITDELLKGWKKLSPMGIIQPYESP